MGTFLEELGKQFNDFILPNFMEYLKMRCVSGNFDSNWQKNKELLKAAQKLTEQGKNLNLKYSNFGIAQYNENNPVLIVTVEGYKSDKNILVYGYLDKNPPMNEEWSDNKNPFDPKVINKILYGRGSSHGWSYYLLLGMIKAMQKLKIPMPRICIVMDFDKLSGSNTMPQILRVVKEQFIKTPDYTISLDGSCLDKDNLYVQTSFKGYLNFNLSIRTMEKGLHSGLGSGIVADSFRIMLDFIDQFESVKTGQVYPKIDKEIPPQQYKFMYDLYQQKNQKINLNFPILENVEKVNKNDLLSYINRGWKTQITLIGQDGIPSVAEGGNVLNPIISLNYSMTFPPNIEADDAYGILLTYLSKIQTLYHAQLDFDELKRVKGFYQDSIDKNLQKIFENVGQEVFQKQTLYYCDGNSNTFIPNVLNLFQNQKFIVTGLQTPDCNSNGGDENIDLNLLMKMLITLGRIFEEFGKLQ